MDLRLRSDVSEVTVIRWDDHGRTTSRTAFRRTRKRKKGTFPVSTIGTIVRRIAQGQRAAMDLYLQRHDEANREQGDGWVRDLPYNVYRATRRGVKKTLRDTGVL